uniref:Slc24a-1 n=1 Tax=Schmidtea mediterranea TaxID=79327 RepID=A0A0H3YFD4_SCHMD|nr:slc24a-1 [Schmidtea mediterranea]
MKKRSYISIWTFLLMFGCLFIFYANYKHDINPINNDKSYISRQLLSYKANCSPKAIDNFPEDLFSKKARQSGALIIHFLITIYMFIGLAIVCEDYFVPCLECICENLKLQPDVAGATFMAAGSSAPELATTIIGVFIAKDDIALGAVVGSADYNLMFVIGLSALFAKTVIQLNWWPLFRDCAFYSISIILLALVIYDNLVYWYEAIVFIFFYGIYIVLNYFNKSLELWAKMLVTKYLPNCTINNENLSDEAFLMSNEVAEDLHTTSTGIEMINSGTESDEDYESGKLIGTRNRNGSCCSSDIDFAKKTGCAMCLRSCFATLELPDKKKARWWNYFYYGLCYPLRFFLCVSIPDCKERFFRKWFWITFINSCIWIGMYSYIMIWMITVIGFTLGIPDSVMGLTFIAAGSSVPDAIASVLVVREGQGDMAVSNAVGSNVFDILICMGVPWLIKCLTLGKPILIYSKGLLYATITLFMTVFGLVFITHLYSWKMTKSFGYILIIIYVAFLVVCCMYELNVFGLVHPPECI